MLLRMTRRQSSIASNAKRKRNKAVTVSHLETNYSGHSFSDLPIIILENILLRLCVKRILVCKRVCKTWYDLISDPEFAKIHFDQAEVCPLVRTSGFTLLSRLIYIVQPEHDGFEQKIRLDAKLKLPLRNFEMIDPGSLVERNNHVKLNMKNHKYRIVSSCNGLLLLSNPSDNDPVAVCNPVTGEFVNLPEVRTARDPGRSEIGCGFGFGFSPVTKQYKVIRMFTRWIEHKNVTVAEVNILGTDSWKDLQCYLRSLHKLFATYLNGCVYWYSPVEPHSVVCFDVEKECFETISPPPVSGHFRNEMLSLGVLGGKLVMTQAYGSVDPVGLWALQDRGTERAWSRIYTFNVSNDDRWSFGSYQPVKYMKDGSLVMFHSHKHAFICKHPTEDRFRYRKIRGLESEVEVIAHVPSLFHSNTLYREIMWKFIILGPGVES